MRGRKTRMKTAIICVFRGDAGVFCAGAWPRLRRMAAAPFFTMPSDLEMMNTEKPKLSFTPRHQAYIALLLWGIAALLLLRQDVYGLDEVAARGLLLSWSIADQVANSSIYFGMPDLRILLFLPIGFLAPGKVFAAKVLTVAVLGITARLLYAWRSAAGTVSALLATGLLLVSPLALAQIDSVSTGPYLLGALAIGAWLDGKYRANPRPFNGWFFALLFASAFSTSLHPAGLALPLALLWSWRTLPQSAKYQRFFAGGVVFSAALLLVMRKGWGDLAWLQNPVFSLSSAYTGSAVTSDFSWAAQWLPGIALTGAALAVVLLRWRSAWPDLLGRSMLIAAGIGMFVGDQAWALLVLAFVLYFGIPLLAPASLAADGATTKQQGVLLGVVFACSTLFMLGDKAYYGEAHRAALTAQDQLIRTLAVAAADERKTADDGAPGRFMVASEWPGRTMVACMCDTVPLPPVIPNKPEQQLAKLRGIDYLMFDPKQTANIELARNFALLGGAVETVSLQDGGVILHVKEQEPAKPEGTKSEGAP